MMRVKLQIRHGTSSCAAYWVLQYRYKYEYILYSYAASPHAVLAWHPTMQIQTGVGMAVVSTLGSPPSTISEISSVS